MDEAQLKQQESSRQQKRKQYFWIIFFTLGMCAIISIFSLLKGTPPTAGSTSHHSQFGMMYVSNGLGVLENMGSILQLLPRENYVLSVVFCSQYLVLLFLFCLLLKSF